MKNYSLFLILVSVLFPSLYSRTVVCLSPQDWMHILKAYHKIFFKFCRATQ